MTEKHTGTTREQAALIAALIRTQRPDWDEPGILKALSKRKATTPALLAVAALRWALNPDAQTPAGIALDGPHWRLPDAGPGDAERHPSAVPLDELCNHCGRDENHCRTRRTDPTDTHLYVSRRQAVIDKARADRAARDATPEPEWSPSDRPYWPRHLKAETLAAVQVGIGVVRSIEDDHRAKQRRTGTCQTTSDQATPHATGTAHTTNAYAQHGHHASQQAPSTAHAAASPSGQAHHGTSATYQDQASVPTSDHNTEAATATPQTNAAHATRNHDHAHAG